MTQVVKLKSAVGTCIPALRLPAWFFAAIPLALAILHSIPATAQTPDRSTESGVAQADRPKLPPPSSEPSFFARWQDRATRTLARQPRWIVPVSSPYPMLIQVVRTDFTRQISPAGVRTWNLGTSRGLNLIPFARTEFDLLIPPFFEHGDKTLDGFGDASFSAKYRIASGNEQHGSYLLSGQLTASIPTGSHANGATDPVLTPNLSGGKGFGKFDVLANVGGTLPTAGTKAIGRTVTTNTVAQYHALRYLWPELYLSSIAWYGSSRDGKVQTFLQPGLIVGRIPLPLSRTKGREGLVAGIGYQTALTTYHTYNHALVFTGRFTF